jgi:hypothetical protein
MQVLVSRRVTYLAFMSFVVDPNGVDFDALHNEFSEAGVSIEVGRAGGFCTLMCDPSDVGAMIEVAAAFGATNFEVELKDQNPPLVRQTTKKTKTKSKTPKSSGAESTSPPPQNDPNETSGAESADPPTDI